MPMRQHRIDGARSAVLCDTGHRKSSANDSGASPPSPVVPDAYPHIQDVTGENGQIVAVFSGKGGIGRTWFSIALSQTLALMKNRTLLVDADLRLANVDVQLGLSPRTDIGDVVERGARLAYVAVPFGTEDLDIVAGRSGTGWQHPLAADQLDALGSDLTESATRYHHIIMDLGAGMGRIVRHMVERAHTVFLLVNPEPTALCDAYASLRWLIGGDGHRDVRIVVNSADSRQAGIITYNALRMACEGLLSKSPKLAGVVRYDPCVPEAIRRQDSLLDTFPNCLAVEDVRVIADKLASNG